MTYTSNLLGGRYRLIRKVGEGGSGSVWEAENVLTRRRVALKRLLHWGDENHRRRLLKEATTCGRVSHRNIVEIIDVGETAEGEPFLVMPLLKGETLGELLTRKRSFAPWLTAQIGRDIAAAIAVLHAVGIIHRDLKPGNIFLHQERGADSPIVKVLDFGVCKELDPKATVLTVDGRIIGTPPYMSPEQFNPRVPLDQRTDIWSLGVILFEMLTGVRPFRGERLGELIGKISNGPIPTVAQLKRWIDPDLVSIVSRCLMRDRDERISSAEELAKLLESHADKNRAPVDMAARSESPGAPDSSERAITSSLTGGFGATTLGMSSAVTAALSTDDDNAKTIKLRGPLRDHPASQRERHRAGSDFSARAAPHPMAEPGHGGLVQRMGSETVPPTAGAPATQNGAGSTQAHNKLASDDTDFATATAANPIYRASALERGAAILGKLKEAFTRRFLFRIGVGFLLVALLSLALHAQLSAPLRRNSRLVLAPALSHIAALAPIAPPAPKPSRPEEPAPPPALAKKEPKTVPPKASPKMAPPSGGAARSMPSTKDRAKMSKTPCGGTLIRRCHLND